MMTLARRACILALAIGLLGLVPPAWGGEPTEELRRTIDQVLDILNHSAPKTGPETAERDAALRRAIEARFDFDETARRALGPYWRERSPQERQEFTRLFRALLERTYVVRIEGYRGERVSYLGESVDDGIAVVRTSILTLRGPDVPVDYRLWRRDDQWLVYDVLIEGVSLVGNYRVQFQNIIGTSSYGELVRRIEAKLDEHRTEDLGSR